MNRSFFSEIGREREKKVWKIRFRLKGNSLLKAS